MSSNTLIETLSDTGSRPSRVAAAPANRPVETRHSRIALLVPACAAVAYLGLCAQLVIATLPHTGGSFIYPLDDTYISMAIAKNFALHGVWNVSPTHFVSATSCPGFLLILAALFRITGPTVWWALVLSLIPGLLAVLMAWRLLRDLPWGLQAAALGCLVFFTPLPLLGLLGMEHTLHILLVLAFLSVAAEALVKRESLSWPALLLTAAMVSIRYESLFFVAVAGLLFLGQRQIRAGFSMGVAAVAPVVGYGTISVLKGGYWLPNTLALKGASSGSLFHAPVDMVNRFGACLYAAPYMGVLVTMMLLLLVVPEVRADRRACALLDMVLGATLIHLALADVGWLYRYEAYLVAAAIVAIAVAARHLRISRNRLATAALLILGSMAGWMLTGRAVEAQRTFPEHSIAIYSQQIQMARLLAQYEPGAVVAANDVGAINYFANITCVDLAGLADREVFWMKRRGTYTTENLARLTTDRGVQVAVLYDSWFSRIPGAYFHGPELPTSWIRVAHWRTRYGIYLGSDLVSFYATSPAEAEKLQKALVLFSNSLPPGEEVTYGQYLPRPASP